MRHHLAFFLNVTLNSKKLRFSALFTHYIAIQLFLQQHIYVNLTLLFTTSTTRRQLSTTTSSTKILFLLLDFICKAVALLLNPICKFDSFDADTDPMNTRPKLLPKITSSFKTLYKKFFTTSTFSFIILKNGQTKFKNLAV